MKEFETSHKDSLEFYTQKMKDLNKEMEDFIKDLIAQNPSYLFSKLQKSYQYIDVPEPPVRADGTIDSSFQAIYYRTHFWDNFDLTDRRFLYLPSFERNMKEYFTRILWLYEPDTINTYIDMVLEKVESDSVMYRYFIEWLSYQFETSKIIGHDAVFVHIAKENQLKGKCTWIDEETLGKYQRRVSSMEPLLIGKKSVELIMPDTSQTTDFSKWHSSYRMSKPYVVLWFYDPTCHTCKSESENLRIVYDSLETIGRRNFDVFAVGSDTDIERWKNYVKDKNYPWINVGGNSANIDFIEVYNIVGNPTMYIIDNSNKEIILNRRIEMNAIPTFLEQYEKMKEAKRLIQQPK
jgi:thiol-disulfide isomerase/thioredoxin